MEAAQSRDALGEKDIVVVFGTVFMMVDARSELGFNEPKVGTSCCKLASCA